MNETIKSNILIVDDRYENLAALEKTLKRPDLNIIKATSGNDALALILEHDFALVLLDVQMSGMDGFETAELIRGNEETKHVPIIFVTAISKEQKYVFKGYEAGAVDYLFKPLDPDILLSKVNVFLDLSKQNKQLQDTTNKLYEAVDKLKDSKKTIEEQNKLLEEVSNRDELTGLYNRRYTTEILDNEFSRALRYKTDLSCLLLDLDFFKGINDTFGHAFGDLVLRGTSDCLKQNIRKQDLLFRYGGEEFLVLLPNTGIDGAISVAEKIRSAGEKKIHNDGSQSTAVTMSIGIASVNLHRPSDGKGLIAFADKALYLAKAEGRNRVKAYMEESSKDSKISENKDIKYLKVNLSAILEKTKKASLESLELLIRDMGGTKYHKHSQEVKRFIELMGEKLLLTPSVIDTFKRAAILHDNFKILLENTIRSKSHVLDERERAEIENHPYAMAELTELFDFFSEERSVLMCHHENFNGSGYPEGLCYNEIPIGARIFAIADAAVAMLSERPYRKSLSTEQVISELIDNSGNQFDPTMVSLFLDIIEEKKILPVSQEVMKNAKEKVRNTLYKKVNPG